MRVIRASNFLAARASGCPDVWAADGALVTNGQPDTWVSRRLKVWRLPPGTRAPRCPGSGWLRRPVRRVLSTLALQVPRALEVWGLGCLALPASEGPDVRVSGRLDG